MSIIPQKRCSKCGVEKPLNQYHHDKHMADGHTVACKACRNAHRQGIYQASSYDRDRRKATYWANPERERAAVKTYRAKHLESTREKGRAWYQANKERSAQNHRRWVVKNRYRRRISIRLYFARRRGNGGSFTAVEWESLKHRYNFACLRCGRKEPEIALTADHIVPVSKGGTSYISNIQPLCVACNSGKCDRTIDYRG